MSLRHRALALLLVATSAISGAASQEYGRDVSLVNRDGLRYVASRNGEIEAISPVDGHRIAVSADRIVIETAGAIDHSSLDYQGKLAVWKQMPAGNFLVVEVPPRVDPFEYFAHVQSVPGIVGVEFDLKSHLLADQYFSYQWGLQDAFSGVESAWTVANGNGVLVGVIDTGVDKDHGDLEAALDLSSDTYSPTNPSHGHGTAVAGIIGALTNNGLGISGVAGGDHSSGVNEDGVTLLVNTHVPTGTGIVEKIEEQAQMGAGVINMSLGVPSLTDRCGALYAASIQAIVETYDVVLVAATGNSGVGRVEWPSCDPHVLAAGAIIPDDTRWPCSQYGPKIDVVAPGGCGIVTTDVTGTDGYSQVHYTLDGCYLDPDLDNICGGGPCLATGCFGGTSAASPFVAGVAALVRSANPALTWFEVQDIIRHTATKVPDMNGQEFHEEYGFGKVNAYQAVLAATKIPADGHISQNTTWSGRVVLGRDVTVDPGVTLTLAPGVEIIIGLRDAQDMEPFFEDRVEIHVKGSLLAAGAASNHVMIRSESLTPTDMDWVHIQVLGGEALLEYVDMSDAEWGIGAATTFPLDVSNSTLSNLHSAGVRVFNNGAAQVYDSHITVTSGVGIEVSAPGLYVDNVTVTGLAGTGTGIEVSGPATAGPITNSNVSGFATGIALYDGETILVGNTVTGCEDGLLLRDGTHLIGAPAGGNEFAYCTNGIFAKYMAPGACPPNQTLSATIRNSYIHHNDVGIITRKTVDSVDFGNASDPGNNIVVDNTLYCAWNVSTACGDLSAHGNYWGDCSPLPPMCFNGPVDWSDPLCSPPSTSPGPETKPDDRKAVPAGSSIVTVAPNPFNPTTTITYRLSTAVASAIDVYNVAGQRVHHADLGVPGPGVHSWIWDGRTQNGEELSSGVYFAVLKAGARTDRRKLILLK